MGDPALKRIRVQQRTHDYHAQLGDDPTIWDCGRSPAEAIGNLILSHPEQCGFDPATREVRPVTADYTPSAFPAAAAAGP